MKCPGCEYELWNLKAGPCPECGRPFKPSEFEFLANAVRFCCPHCDQDYYGTSERGQLEPDAFACIRCGNHVTTDDMILRPADALGGREATRATNPWFEPKRKRRWFATIGAGLGMPGRLLEATPAIGGTGPAFGYAAINFTMAGALGLALAMLLLFAGGGAGPLVFIAIASVLIPFAYLFFWTLLTHGLLKLFKQPTPDGLGRTFQALAFTSGVWLFGLMMCMGWPLGFIAWSACAPIAVRSAHKCRTSAAVVATLVPPALVVLSIFALYIISMVGVFASATSTMTNYGWTSGTRLEWEVIPLANELRSAVTAGNPPLHGASLLGRNSPVFFNAFSDANAIDPLIGQHTASALDAMSDHQRTSELAAITAGWPADVTAHRIGRIVFTHHGITPGSDPGLWLMIELPIAPGDDFADAVHLSGASMFNVRHGAQQAIDQQNLLRVAEGLPPLPSYQTLTTTTGPWTAANGAPVAPAPPGVP
ncbi:MAG: hypothetical protein ACIAQU_05860 [Phycisphaerales bacterium JB064]